jgi:hypothetical protein
MLAAIETDNSDLLPSRDIRSPEDNYLLMAVLDGRKEKKKSAKRA